METHAPQGASRQIESPRCNQVNAGNERGQRSTTTPAASERACGSERVAGACKASSGTGETSTAGRTGETGKAGRTGETAGRTGATSEAGRTDQTGGSCAHAKRFIPRPPCQTLGLRAASPRLPRIHSPMHSGKRELREHPAHPTAAGAGTTRHAINPVQSFPSTMRRYHMRLARGSRGVGAPCHRMRFSKKRRKRRTGSMSRSNTRGPVK